MAKTKISEYDSTAANNTDIDSINIAEGMAPSNVNNAIRELMAHLKDGLGAGTPVFLDQTNNRLGVGTTSPSVLLDLESTAPTIRFTDSDASGTPECEISGAGGDITIRADRDNEKASSIIGFEVDGSERMRIDSSGLLRVGNTTGSIYNSSSVTGVVAASSSLQVASPSATTAFFNRQGNDGQIVGLYKDGSQIGSIGTYASDLTIGDADVGIRFDTGTGLVPWNVSTNAATDGAIDIGASSARIKDLHLTGNLANGGDKFLYSYAAGSVGQVRSGVYYNGTNNVLAFYTSQNERARVDGDGNFLVRRTAPISGNQHTFQGDGTGDTVMAVYQQATSGYAQAILGNNTTYVFFGRGTEGSITQTGSITNNGSSTAYNTSSDYRLKENVTDVTDGITRVKQLSPKRFNWIADESNTTVDGFLAHEAQAVVPEAVTGTHDGMTDEEYEVSAATGDIYTPATEEAEEVIHSSNVEQPETLEEGQFWRETTAAVMGTRSVPDYQGIDQSKLVPLLTAALQEAIAKIEALETRVAALEG